MSASALPAAVRRPADCRSAAFPRPAAAPTQQTDDTPYNTTATVFVFVGDLSPLVARTFVVPFGRVSSFWERVCAGFPLGGVGVGSSSAGGGARASPGSGASARPACAARPGARHPNPNANPNANAVGGTTPALLEGTKHGASAGFGCRALQPLPLRPAGERESVRTAVEARIRPVRLRVVMFGESYGGANGSSCPKAYRNAFHSSPSKGMSSAMYMYIPARTALTAVRTPHFTDEALKMQRGGKVPMRGAYEVPAPPSTATRTSTSRLLPFSSETHQLRASISSHSSGLGSSSTGTGTEGGTRTPHPNQPYAYARGSSLAAERGRGEGGVRRGSSASSNPTRGYGSRAFAAGTTRSLPAFQANRYQGHVPHPLISRPGEAWLCQHQQQQGGGYRFDAVGDLKGMARWQVRIWRRRSCLAP
ncbi:hypothetical protein MSAN_01512100 [Mycena sanguinolenta]|uniref:Uncharacterized protein n=1 Tax=Mycena sanguinolenta TaxID=230812 RepID=A0A8H6Y4Q6_9AGAR|nr:hypothetical protein MSAN_01512100 [Mycena sanguinolenta]